MKIVLRVITASAAFLLFSCSKSYLNVNTTPNRAVQAGPELVLPAAEGYAAYNIGNYYQILGGFWSQYWTQGPTGNQYNIIDQYAISATTYDRPWQSLYSGPLSDLNYVYDVTNKTSRKNYAAIARFLQAYIFQVLTDLHGDIPFTEALKGEQNLTPKFDPQPIVYDGLIKLIDEGLSLVDLNVPDGSFDKPGVQDLIYGGKMDLWVRFANTLKLKVYLRQAYIRPDVSALGISALYANGANFLGNASGLNEAKVSFSTTQFNTNPIFTTKQGLNGTINIVASGTILDYLTAQADPRIGAFFNKAIAAPSVGLYVGITQGDAKNLPNPATLNGQSYSEPGDAVAGAAAPVIFMSASESLFLQAEAAVRGFAPQTAVAATLYSTAIDSSFKRWGLLANSASYKDNSDVVFPTAGSQEEQIKRILTEKWVSLCGTENAESWIEWRRTGYPDFFIKSRTNLTGDVFPRRLFYPSSEITRNPNTPPQILFNSRVWWDVHAQGQI